jgi:hypothetical protein
MASFWSWKEEKILVDPFFFFLNENNDDGYKDGSGVLGHHEKVK